MILAIVRRQKRFGIEKFKISLILIKRSPKPRHLRIVKDGQGVYRVGGKLENAHVPFTAKYPVLLQRRHHFTELVGLAYGFRRS